MNAFSQNWSDLPHLLSWHLVLSMCAVASASVIALSIALLADAKPHWKRPSLAVAGMLQTIPGLALLALMVPLLGSIGFAPAFAALTVYALLPLMQNTITGLGDIDERLIDAARGMGMTERQILFQVRFPLAFPIILAGLRTSTVWTVGTTTLATAVGASGLGRYIFTGLQTRNHPMTLFGCFFAAALAIVLDQLLAAVEDSVRTRRRRPALVAATVLTVGLVAATAGALWPAATSRAQNGPVKSTATEEAVVQDTGLPLAGKQLTVGSKMFVEQIVLGELIAQHLESQGAGVTIRSNMGSTILFDALSSNAVDCYVDYTGTIFTTLMRRVDRLDRVRTRIEAANYLLSEHGVVMIGTLGFENNYALAMRRDRAQGLGVSTIADLSGTGIRISGDPEVFGRPEWQHLSAVYSLESLITVPMQAIYRFDSVRDGQVDATLAYTTDGRLSYDDLVVIEDSRQAFPSYDATLLVSPEASKDRVLMETLAELVNTIDDVTMREANVQVELEGETPRSAASWLLSVANGESLDTTL